MFCLSFASILGVVAMKILKVGVVIQGVVTFGGIDLKEVSRGFPFPNFPLINSGHVGN